MSSAQGSEEPDHGSQKESASNIQPSAAHSSKDTAPEEPYSIYTKAEKWFIVGLISMGATFSPLSSMIYLPAIPTIADAFGKSIELINLTVTLFMIFQGISPTFWGTLADRHGRRLMFIACLTLLALSCVGLALTPTSAYWLLMLLRCVQSAGSASTVALSAGVVVDIAEPEERGIFFGLSALGPLIRCRPAVGPVIGGALTDGLGWRSMFWFICICSATCALIIALFLPETLRVIVDNGRYLPPKISRPVFPILGRRVPKLPSRDLRALTFSNPLRILLNVDILALLVAFATVFAMFYAVTTSISSLFSDTYPFLTDTTIGLSYMTIGGGMMIMTVTFGKILDVDYQRLQRKMLGDAAGTLSKAEVDANIPIEQVRLRLVRFVFPFYVALCIGFGWCLDRKVSIAGPLVLLFFIGTCATAIMNMVQTLLVDLMPKNGAAVSACNNLLRCVISAALVSVIQLLLDSLGPGWTFVLLGGVCSVLFVPCIWFVLRVGPRWRERRRNAKA
ncbi:major facilitator superfamily domain-containing protein [Schizophyllum amplum]|uniref:Major facilitator superfamily domain-containing protein n=1 Tax=Schizophyllum amplum TaxID=97359 RepID=A0A550CMC3_9AGAR|nr:major facilitator superfamily domain-containing protein [Auriculariopsis ampla]